jgi:hypothetical protein
LEEREQVKPAITVTYGSPLHLPQDVRASKYLSVQT